MSSFGILFLNGCTSNSTVKEKIHPPSSSNFLLTQDETSIYQAAKREGKLVYYTAFFHQEVINEIGAAFTKKYPSIQFEGTRKPAATLFGQLVQEMQAGIKNCDVFGTADIGQMLLLKKQNQLLQYQPLFEKRLKPELRQLDPGNFYQAGALVPIVIGFNTQEIRPDEAPKSWLDLLNSKYKDRISTGSAATSGQVGTWALAMEQKFGWDNYFNRFSQLNPKLGRSINDTVTDIVPGERAIGIVPLGQTQTAKAKGNPIDVVYPAEGTVVVIGPIGILKNSPHPNTAKLFMNFVSSKEYSQTIAKRFEQPLRSDVSIERTKLLNKNNSIIPTPKQIETDIPHIKKKWQDKFGI